MSWGTNVLVGQSGGPTAVINSSLAGVYEAAKALGAAHVYGMEYGIQGFCRARLWTWMTALTTRWKLSCSSARRPVTWQLPVQAAQPRHGRTPLCAAV